MPLSPSFLYLRMNSSSHVCAVEELYISLGEEDKGGMGEKEEEDLSCGVAKVLQSVLHSVLHAPL
jgi:hypothetical protein